MKRIINRKVYNTQTAVSIAEWDNGLGRTDFNAIEETLYKTKKGQYFLHAWGGAATCYSESYGNCSSEGQTIKLFDENEAINWLEKKGFVTEIEEHFSDKIEEG